MQRFDAIEWNCVSRSRQTVHSQHTHFLYTKSHNEDLYNGMALHKLVKIKLNEVSYSVVGTLRLIRKQIEFSFLHAVFD